MAMTVGETERRRLDAELLASFHRVTDALSRDDTSLIRELRNRGFLSTALSLAASATMTTLQSASLSAVAAFLTHPSGENALAELARGAPGEALFRGIFTSKAIESSTNLHVGSSLVSLLMALSNSDDGLRVIAGESGVEAVQVSEGVSE